MADPNVHTPEWEVDYRDTAVKMRAVRVGAAAGTQALGASLFEVEVGGMVSPYHLHHGNEELAVVLVGRPQLRTPDGTRRLEPGSVVAFPAGPGGAHHLSNPGPETVRVLIVSTMNFPEIAEHVSTGTTMAMTGPAEGKVFPAGAEQDFLTLYKQAIAVDATHDDAER
ncbi:MAG: cupin domain-containing protein [Solirubrobacteraceae bacterium]